MTDQPTNQPTDPSYSYTPKTDDQLCQLAMDIVSNLVFGTWSAPPESNPSMAFLPLAIIGPDILQQFKSQDIAHVYEYLDRAGPNTVNGMPVFFSMQLLNNSDAIKLRNLVDRLNAAINAANQANHQSQPLDQSLEQPLDQSLNQSLADPAAPVEPAGKALDDSLAIFEGSSGAGPVTHVPDE